MYCLKYNLDDLCWTQMSGNMAVMQKKERLWTFLWVTCKPILVPCSDPGQLGFLFDGKLKRLPQHYTNKYGGAIPHSSNHCQESGPCCFVSNRTVMLTEGERSHSSRPTPFVGCTHRSKRQPEYFPNYFKPLFEWCWGNWGCFLRRCGIAICF